MNLDGKQLINSLCRRLEIKGEKLYSSNIVNLLRSLSNYDLNQLITFGNINKWSTEESTRLKKESLYHGMSVKCIISNIVIDDAKVSFDDNDIYICQNIINGIDCKKKFGYRYSWVYYNFSVKKYTDSVTMLIPKKHII
jgi:hypothetical protein